MVDANTFLAVWAFTWWTVTQAALVAAFRTFNTAEHNKNVFVKKDFT